MSLPMNRIWRRLALVPFTVQIPSDDVDKTLIDRLRGELPGILSWAVRGCLDWQKNGLRPPQQVIDAVSSYRTEMDTLCEFLADRCVVAKDVSATAKELYESYRGWAIASGHQPFSNMRFGLALGERGFVKRKSGVVSWYGIGLADENPGHLDTSDTSPSSPYTCARGSANAEQVSEVSKCPRCDGEGCESCGYQFVD